MGLSSTENKQIEIPLEVSNESPEVLILIEETKKGNDDAAELLLKRYNKLLHGDYIRGFLNFNFNKSVNKQDNEDVYSILNILFMETVNSYDPSRGKFITHLTNRIKFKFREYLLKERMIPVATNKSAKEVLEVLEKSQCALMSNIGDELVKSDKQLYVSFKFNGEQMNVPLKIFVDNFIMDKIDKVIPKKYNALYRKYLSYIENTEHGMYTLLAKEFDLNINQAHYAVKLCNAIMSKSIKIKNINIITD